jgi:hypothetical protein
MSAVRLIWPPAPYTAGFCITDDTDAATSEQVRAVYDFLSDRGFRCTKTVWVFRHSEPCGIPPIPDSALRGVTFEDEAYRSYCEELFLRGFEICLHGASAGNNRRERQEAALAMMERDFRAPGTYICHSKNADNPYWEARTTRLWPFRNLLASYSRHRCAGEDPASPYYWGDLCFRHVEHIRLLRTRCTNTLAANPSMPYYDPAKPLVRSWFSATKRAMRDCATPRALAALRRAHGLTVLYQYLHRYAHPVTQQLDPDFMTSVDRILACGDILVAPVGTMMRRLRLMQGFFLCSAGDSHWAVNITREDAHEVQLAGGVDAPRIVLPPIPAGQVIPLHLPPRLRITGRNAIRLPRARRAVLRLGTGTLSINCSDDAAAMHDIDVPPMSWRYTSRVDAPHRPLSVLPRWEEYRLLAGQAAIIAREILFRGRSLDTNAYLGGEAHPLEQHENW